MTTLTLIPGLGSVGPTVPIMLFVNNLLAFGATQFKGGISGADYEKAAPAKNQDGS